jgi:hypothetical protein
MHARPSCHMPTASFKIINTNINNNSTLSVRIKKIHKIMDPDPRLLFVLNLISLIFTVYFKYKP